MQHRTIHPFPARMAPGLATASLSKLRERSVVLDPMSGSGTVLKHAVALGHNAIGFDMDPLAVLMSRVWTTHLDRNVVKRELSSVLSEAKAVDLRTSPLPWMQGSSETKDFVNYWFAAPQRRNLHRLAFVLHGRQKLVRSVERQAAVDVLRLGLSRIIVTKEQGASLARDTSHSRPHRVADTSEFDVFAGFERAVHHLSDRVVVESCSGTASVALGDARRLPLEPASVDAVVTSPPYLNAIDYLRGHRLSLVWLGYSIEALREIRSESIGAERAQTVLHNEAQVQEVVECMLREQDVLPRLLPMIRRYAADLLTLTQQVQRVMRPGAQATFVVGNSCLRGTFIRNSDGLARAAALNGLMSEEVVERELPIASRYLPVTGDALSKRMRTETVLTFLK